MSNIFQPLTRSSGGLVPLNIGVGALVDPVMSQGLNLDSTGSIYAALDGVIDYHTTALPFDLNGRLVVSNGAATYTDQGIPFTASGAVALGGAVEHYCQSLAYDQDSKLSTTLLMVGAFSSAFSFAFDRVTA